jgi:hypothetical protein
VWNTGTPDKIIKQKNNAIDNCQHDNNRRTLNGKGTLGKGTFCSN